MRGEKSGPTKCRGDGVEARQTAALRLTGAVILGCALLACDEGNERKSALPDASVAAVTWHQDIAPIVTAKCTGCHTQQGIAPFSMDSYDVAKPFATQIASAVEAGRMPPFLAQETPECHTRYPWQHDLRLSAQEKTALRAWADNGAPEGDAATAAAVLRPQPPVLEREDVAMLLPEAITVEGSKDIHTCVIVDPKLAADSYVVGRLITSGNPRVLHHVVSYLVAPGQNADGTDRSKEQLEQAIRGEKGAGIGGRYDCFGGPGITAASIELLDAWAPGGVPNLAPPNSGQPIDKDALVVMDVHYHPAGEPQTDRTTKLSLMLARERPALISRILLLGNFEQRRETAFGDGDLVKQPDEQTAQFVIPPNAGQHIEEMTWTWKLPTGSLRLYGAGTHMHYVGQGARVVLERASPTPEQPASECLIETPAWDFNWQRAYYYDATYETFSTVSTGDVLKLRCLFNNTMQNPHVARALGDLGMSEPVEVRLGEDTLDEMCLAALGIIYPNPQ